MPCRRIPVLLCLGLCLSPAAPLRARPTSATAAAAANSASAESLRVSLVTMGPGEEVWEKWGHNAILIEDPASGIAVAYNYGIFDFEQPNFIGRFVLGRMTYSMDAEYAGPMLQGYIDDNRSVLIQELNLSPEQARHLWDFLEWNRRPENRNYLYDYYRSNCSTKIRDALDRPDVLGGQLRAQLTARQTSSTYRSHTRIGSAQNVWIYTGLELALGRRTDVPLSAWDDSFVPVELSAHLRSVTVRDPATGEVLPLVRSERLVYRSTRPPLPEKPPVWTWAYLLIGLAYSAVLLWTVRLALRDDPKKARRGRIGFGAAAVLWSLISGGAGAFLIFGLTTNHIAAHHNDNLLVFPPVSLLLVWLAVSAVRGSRYARFAVPIAVLVLVLAVLGLLANALPALRQWNWDMIALAVPIHAAMVYALYRLPPVAARVTGDRARTRREARLRQKASADNP